MAPKRNENLNTFSYWKTSYGKKQKYKDHKNFHYRGDIKIAGKETDMQKCNECHKIFPAVAFTTSSGLRGDGAWYLKKMCRQCATVSRRETRQVKKNAPPQPDRCACCHREKKLQVDHLHGSTTFRGWLCSGCNTGMGKLGDNLEGILQAAVYLENDKNKIIETLSKVFNEMFARTK